jgi:hypothetical protein
MITGELTFGKSSAIGMILGDGTEVRMGNTYGQGEVGDERGSKEMDRCPLTIALNCLPGCYTRIFNCSGILD